MAVTRYMRHDKRDKMSSYLPSFLKATPPSPFVDHTKIQAPQIYPEKYGEVSNAVPLSSFPSLVTAIKSGKYGRANNMEALLKSPVGQFLKATAPIFESREASWSEWLGLMPTQVAGDVS